MDFTAALNERHSVRSYLEKPIEDDKTAALQKLIDACNRDGNLHIQLVLNEPKAFNSLMAHYGKFTGVQNYVALIGKKTDDLQEKIGYYGEKIALFAQTLGLNTCWVAMTYKKIKTAFRVEKGEKLACVLALGYGATQGVPHKSKSPDAVCAAQTEPIPAWFTDGVNAALLAPTAMNQQKFHFLLTDGNKVKATTKSGFYAKIDLGIAKYHFELGAGTETFAWV